MENEPIWYMDRLLKPYPGDIYLVDTEQLSRDLRNCICYATELHTEGREVPPVLVSNIVRMTGELNSRFLLMQVHINS